ncbi:rnase p rpr2 rpp21 subunit domain-containing protein [Ophiostoma piceae UAMH 11346]|uniref:Rnase p rpr2 rpp21 subunit domain-containing protein n=1 Tax=Ophiostoma piceae (strain UAMH 11346) TaxID=1262450 RepID=S3C6L0_OPHP1|nr:rnase p rpr2 rpp21 subunit domain-containing protein [Ophiostoma piceae UAMH 11346]
MAKSKGAASSAVANRTAYSRVSFLYQAAALLAATQTSSTSRDANTADDSITESAVVSTAPEVPDPALMGMSRRLLTQMRSISRKTNMRLRPAVKHRVCKFCDSLLVEGSTCSSAVENQSRGGRKAWADVLAVTCKTCGRVRRYPVSAERQPRRPYRGQSGEEAPKHDGAVQPATQNRKEIQRQNKAKLCEAVGNKGGPG